MPDTDLDALIRTPEPEHASIPAASWRDLWEYHIAMSGTGEHGYNWKDKPHRLVYDLTAMCAKHRAEIAALRARLTPTPHADDEAAERGMLADLILRCRVPNMDYSDRLEAILRRLSDLRARAEAAEERARVCAVASLQWENRWALKEAERMELHVKMEDAERELAEQTARAAALEASQIPTPPAGMHYELVPDGETLSEITDEWGKTTKAMLLNKVDAVVATKRAEAAEAKLARAETIVAGLRAALEFNTKEPTDG